MGEHDNLVSIYLSRVSFGILDGRESVESILRYSLPNRPLASSIISPGVDRLMAEFNSDNDVLGSLVVSVFVLGFAFGPTILGPLSEIYGRWIIYSICSLLLLIFNILCAVSSSMGMLIAMRFLAGVFGGCPLAVGGGTIADLFSTSERGFATGIYMMGSIIGPAYGPVIGGFLSQAEGWRWVFWLLTILVMLLHSCPSSSIIFTKSFISSLAYSFSQLLLL